MARPRKSKVSADNRIIKSMSLSEKQRRFVAEYLVDLNATQAAIRAGYSKKTANEQGAQLLAKLSVAEAIRKGQDKKLAKLEITAESVLLEIAKLAYANMHDYVRRNEDGTFEVDLSKLSRDQCAAIQEVIVDTIGGTGDGERRQVQRTRFKLADKGQNLERLGRYLKLFTDRLELPGLESLEKRIAEFLAKTT